MFEYISVKEAAAKWEVSERRIQKLCKENRIEGVLRFGHSWLIPCDAEKPLDRRKFKEGKDGDMDVQPSA